MNEQRRERGERVLLNFVIDYCFQLNTFPSRSLLLSHHPYRLDSRSRQHGTTRSESLSLSILSSDRRTDSDRVSPTRLILFLSQQKKQRAAASSADEEEEEATDYSSDGAASNKKNKSKKKSANASQKKKGRGRPKKKKNTGDDSDEEMDEDSDEDEEGAGGEGKESRIERYRAFSSSLSLRVPRDREDCLAD